MRLHIAAEDLGLYVHEESLRSTIKLPAAARELARIKEDILLVQQSIEKALKRVEPAGTKDSRHRSGGVHAELEQLFDMKRDMVTARDTLEEASNLASLFKTIDTMMSSGDDIVRLSEALKRFENGLRIVGDSLPEFRQGRAKVAALEERIFDMAVQKLDHSLNVQNGEACKIACTVLDQVGRSGLIGQHYSTIRSQPLLQLWEGYSASTPYSSWIPTFYDEVLRSVVTECDWCQTYVSECYPGIILDMLMSFFRRIEVPCKARLAGATSQSSISSLQSIETMEQTVDATAEFVDALFDSLRNASAITDNLVEKDLMKSIIIPYDDVLKNYPSKEMNHMKNNLDCTIDSLKHAFTSNTNLEEISPDSIIATLTTSIDDMHTMVLEGLQRCWSTTSGTEISDLHDIIDDIVAAYCDALLMLLPGNTFGDDLASMLKLLPVMDRLAGQVTDIKGNIRDRITSLSNGLEMFEKRRDDLTGIERLNFLRVSWNSGLYGSIQRVCSPEFKSLKKVSVVLDTVRNKIEDMIEKSFTRTLERHFEDVSESMASSQPQTNSNNDGMSPTFSSYPLQYVIAAGEHLMMLPQLLETSVGSMNLQEDVQEDMVSAWIDKLTSASCKVYSQKLEKLTDLSPGSSLQLSADIEYFCNILNSLGCEIPVKISAWQAGLATTDEDGMKSLLDSIGDNAEASNILTLISKLRGFQL